MPSAQPMPSHRSHSFQSFSHNTSSGEPSTVRAPSRRENSTVPLRSALSMRRQDSAPTPVQSGSTPSMTDPATSELGTTFAGKRRTKSLSGKSVSGKSTRSMRSLGSMGSLNSKTGRVGKYRAFEGSVHDLGAFEDAKPRKKSTSKPPSSFPSNLARSLSTSASTPSAPTLQRNKSVPNLRIALGKLTRSGSVSHTSSLPESRPGSPSLSTSPSASPQKGAGTPLSSSAASIRTTNTAWTACTTISTNTAHTGFSALTSTSTIRSKVPGNPSHPFIDYVPGPLFAQAPRVCMGSRYADKALPRLPSDVLDDDDGYEDEIEAKDDMSNQGAQPGRTASTRRAKGNMPPVPRVPTMYASPATLARRASERERQAAAAAKSSLSSGPKRRSRLHLQVRFRNSAHRTSQASMIAQEWKKRQSALMAEGVPSPLPRMVPEEDRMSGEGSKGGVNGGVKDVKDVRERQEQAGEEVVFVPRSTPPSAEHPRLRETRAEGYSANERPPSLPPTAPAHVGPTRPPRIVPPALTLSQPSQTAGLSRPPAKYAPSSMPHSSRKPPSAASPPTARSDTYTLDVDIPSSRISRVSRYMGDWAWHADHMAEEAGKEVAMLPVSRVATRPSLPILARAQFAPMPLERMDGSPARPTGTVTPRSLTASGQGQMVGNFTEGTMKVDVSADDIAEAAAVLIMGTSRASAVPAERRFIQREASGTDVWKAGALDMQARCASSAMPRGDRHALNAKASSATPRPSKLALTSSNYTTTKFTHLTSAISTGATGISSSTNSMTRSDSSTSTASTSSISTTDSASSLHSFESVTSDILSSYASTLLSGSSGKFAPVTASAGVHARDRHRASTASDSASPLGTPTPMTASKAYIAARVSPIASRVNVPPRAPVRSNTLPHAADASVRSLSGEAGVEVRRDSGNSGLSDLVDLVHLASLSSAQYLVPFMRNNGSGSSAGSVREPKCSQTVINSPSSVVVQTKVIGVKVERPTVRADTTSETSSPAQMLAQTYIQSRMANGSAAGQQAPGSIGEGGEKRSRGRLNRSSSIVGGTVVSPARRQMRHGAGASSERSFGVEVGRAGMRVVREE